MMAAASMSPDRVAVFAMRSEVSHSKHLKLP
jgi:hypothetical protein